QSQRKPRPLHHAAALSTGAAVSQGRDELAVVASATADLLRNGFFAVVVGLAAALAFSLLQEAYADLVALDVGQLPLAVGGAGRGEHQEELVERDVLDAAFDCELGAGPRDARDVALAPPGPVDAHDARLEAGLEDDLIGPFVFRFHTHDLAPHAGMEML